MRLSESELHKLRQALVKLRADPLQRPPADVLVELTAALPRGVGMTIDFEAEKTLGHPLVVIRPSLALPSCFATLTPRELEVAGLVAAGLRNADIALALGIKLSTVKDHVHRALNKSGLDGRAAIVAHWVEPSN